MQWQFSCITDIKLQCNVGTKSVLIWLYLFLFLMIKGQHTHLYNNKEIVITSKGWKYTQAKTKLTTHCVNKSNEEMKTSHTHILEKLVIKNLLSYNLDLIQKFININICTPTHIFTQLWTLKHLPCHINITSRFCYHINKLQLCTVIL